MVCSRAEVPFFEERAQPFTTADPRSKPISIFCRPALIPASIADSCVGNVPLFSDTRERLAEYLFHISDLAFKAAGCASAIVDGDAGEHARRQLQHAAVTAENYVHDAI
jgi:hypothetical protein